jgi:phage head maturation protease
MTQLKNASFKYTVPISKAEADDDGLYITGEASGPEIDIQDERIAPEAIKAFANQIKERAASGDPIPYLDEHDKSTSGRGVLRHLGDLVDGEITDNNHLRVKVRLNEDNPAATFLYRQIVAGKKFGMSINGDVLEFADELVKSIGRKIRTFKSVILTHVANTTRPVWTPSLGTVLNRAVEKALADEGNGEEMAEETVVESTAVEEATTTETPAVEETTTVEATAVEAETETETPAAPATTPVETKLDALISAFATLAEALKPATPAAEVARSEDETPEPVVSKSESDDRFAALEAELAELKERSATPTPPLVTKAAREEFEGLMSEMSPQERLRVSLAAIHGEDIS